MRDQEKILYFLKVVGPTIPSKVAKHINTEILLASAHLSDLAAQGKVKISNLKIGGGSPLYYLPGQEDQLFHFAAGNLNPKDYQVLEALKQQKIMRENSLDLLSRVALRSLKDFAVPLHVTISGNKELFWKWHLLSDEGASAALKEMLLVREQTAPYQTPEKLRDEQNFSQPSIFNLPEHSAEQSARQQGEHTAEQPAGPLAEQQTKLEKASSASFPASANLSDSSTRFTDSTEQDELLDAGSASEETGTELQEKIERTPNKPRGSRAKRGSSKKSRSPEDNFLPSAESFFAGKDILIQEREIVRKNAEINLVIKVPSAVGTVTYFCKAKNKAKCDEGDVSAAYMEAQIKKLPLLFLYTHGLTKKAQEMLAADAFQNALVARLEKGD